jgi:hypothetical protein
MAAAVGFMSVWLIASRGKYKNAPTLFAERPFSRARRLEKKGQIANLSRPRLAEEKFKP